MEVLQQEPCERTASGFDAASRVKVDAWWTPSSSAALFLPVCDWLLRRHQHPRLRDFGSLQSDATWEKLRSDWNLTFSGLWRNDCWQDELIVVEHKVYFFFFSALLLFPSVLRNHTIESSKRICKCKCYFICRSFISTSNIYLIYLMTGEFLSSIYYYYYWIVFFFFLFFFFALELTLASFQLICTWRSLGGGRC